MMLLKKEQRDHIRMQTNSAPIRFRCEVRQVWFEGSMENLSASGLSIRAAPDASHECGAVLVVHVEPALSVTAPLAARVEVIHCTEDGEDHVMGCRIMEFVSHDEL